MATTSNSTWNSMIMKQYDVEGLKLSLFFFLSTFTFSGYFDCITCTSVYFQSKAFMLVVYYNTFLLLELLQLKDFSSA